MQASAPWDTSNLDLDEVEIVELNMRSLVGMTNRFVPMRERKQGTIINVASTAAFQPVPFMTYAASKALCSRSPKRCGRRTGRLVYT
jgi:short-subunit dehydrogenase